MSSSRASLLQGLPLSLTKDALIFFVERWGNNPLTGVLAHAGILRSGFPLRIPSDRGQPAPGQ